MFENLLGNGIPLSFYENCLSDDASIPESWDAEDLEYLICPLLSYGYGLCWSLKKKVENDVLIIYVSSQLEMEYIRNNRSNYSNWLLHLTGVPFEVKGRWSGTVGG